MRRPAAALAAVLCLFGQRGAALAAPTAYTGTVAGVFDGDTVKLDVGGRRVVFRLGEIDAPELEQAFGREAKDALSGLVMGKAVRAIESTTDSYGRAVGRLYVDGLDVNAALIEQGYAWVYTHYAKDPRFPRFEREARRAARGLWHLPEGSRVPPWIWRHHSQRHGWTQPTTETRAATCGAKQYCRQMASCAEARDYLTRCGVRTLDGDGDGTPCEALCEGGR